MKNFIHYTIVLLLSIFVSGCQLGELEFQQDVDYDYHVLDPKINMTAWEYMNLPRADTGFSLLLKGIAYAGIDPQEYQQPGRTFFLLFNDAILKKDSRGVLDKNCFFARVKGTNGKPGTKWEDYPVDTVRNLLLYHIVPDGVFSYDNLTPDNLLVNTLLPPEKSTPLLLKVMNDRNSKIRLNDFIDTIKFAEVRSSNIQTTNGVVHVLTVYAEYGKK